MRRIHQQIQGRYSHDLPVGVAAARQIRLAMSSQMCDKHEHPFGQLQPGKNRGKPVLCPVNSFLPSETGFLPSETMQRSCTDAHAELREGAARPRTGPLHRLCPRCRTRSVCRCRSLCAISPHVAAATRPHLISSVCLWCSEHHGTDRPLTETHTRLSGQARTATATGWDYL